MSQNQAATLTHHALLIAWGQFAQCIGLIAKLEEVPLHQKTVEHSPQRKVLEFLVAILGGFTYLKDISLSAHPLDQDDAVAQAWGQSGWADYSGVSRALSVLEKSEAQQVIDVLAQVSQAFIDQEVLCALRGQGKLVYDGDLTERPVSNTSTTYPDVAYGHMSDTIQLGYQAAMVSLHSPTYGRQWFSVAQHPGNVLACSQAETMIRAAEDKTGVRPRRRTELLRQRLAQAEEERERWATKDRCAEKKMAEMQRALQDTQVQRVTWQKQVAQYEMEYQERGRPERPHSRLAKARHKVGVYQRRQKRREEELKKAKASFQRQQAHLEGCLASLQQVEQRLHQSEQENALNPASIRAEFRVDAGFGTPENVALLIEMRYDVYTKPYGTWLRAYLKKQVDVGTRWTPVGSNAEMTAWQDFAVKDFPYPLDVALERFDTGKTPRYSILLHYGQDPAPLTCRGGFRPITHGRLSKRASKKEKVSFRCIT